MPKKRTRDISNDIIEAEMHVSHKNSTPKIEQAAESQNIAPVCNLFYELFYYYVLKLQNNFLISYL